MTYADRQKILVDSMGTAKAKRKGDSMRQSRVQDDDGTARGNKGVRDTRVKEMATEVANDTNEMKKAQSNSEARKNTLYGKDALMPQAIFDVLPYKETHTAL
jgi:hypothetical protein